MPFTLVQRLFSAKRCMFLLGRKKNDEKEKQFSQEKSVAKWQSGGNGRTKNVAVSTSAVLSRFLLLPETVVPFVEVSQHFRDNVLLKDFCEKIELHTCL